MLGSSLRVLARAADIAKLDIAPNAVVLEPASTPEGMPAVTAWYRGSYVACSLTVPGGIAEAYPVAAADFAAIAGLFSDQDDVSLTVSGGRLIISTKGRRATLQHDTRVFGTDADTVMASSPLFTIPAADFRREAAVAIGIAATTPSVPILTGLRLITNGKAARVGYQAADASSLVYEATSACTVTPDAVCDIVAPAKDLLVALSILEGDTIEVGTAPGGRALILRTPTAAIKLPLLGGKWPDLSRVRRLEYAAEPVVLPADAIQACATAARIYKVSTECTLRPVEGGIVLESEAGEAGQFQEFIPPTFDADGVASAPLTRAVAFDVADLEQASRIAVNAPVSLYLGDTMARAVAEDRKLYILQRVARAS